MKALVLNALGRRFDLKNVQSAVVRLNAVTESLTNTKEPVVER